jgi:uncharacterized protein
MKKLLISLFLFGFFSSLSAQDFPQKPTGFVTDLAGVLKPEEVQALNVLIRNIADSSSNEIAVIIFADAQGYAYSDLAIKVAETWGIGDKKNNNGVLIALYIKERGYAYQVGYGLEPVLTDLTTRRIFDAYMKPQFRRGDYFQGLYDAIQVTGAVASGEFNIANAYGKEDDIGKDIAGIVVLVIIFLVILMAFLARNHGGGPGGRGGIMSSALPYLLLGTHMGSRGGFGGGGGGFGGSSGGGFGGFGGGGFGGGGSSGSW